MTGNSIRISWHFTPIGRAWFTPSGTGGRICINQGPHEYDYPSLDIFMGCPVNARLAAAAINGDLTDVLERAHDICGGVGNDMEGASPLVLDAVQLAGEIKALLEGGDTT